MNKDSGSKDLQTLIDVGKERGYLTYDEVNEVLPQNGVTSDQLDDVMSMFGEMDIEIVDGTRGERVARPAVWIRLVSLRRKPSLSASRMHTRLTSGRSSPSRSRLIPTTASYIPARKSCKISTRSNVSTSLCK